jgi:hypothetical protein
MVIQAARIHVTRKANLTVVPMVEEMKDLEEIVLALFMDLMILKTSILLLFITANFQEAETVQLTDPITDIQILEIAEISLMAEAMKETGTAAHSQTIAMVAHIPPIISEAKAEDLAEKIQAIPETMVSKGIPMNSLLRLTLMITEVTGSVATAMGILTNPATVTAAAVFHLKTFLANHSILQASAPVTATMETTHAEETPFPEVNMDGIKDIAAKKITFS